MWEHFAKVYYFFKIELKKKRKNKKIKNYKKNTKHVVVFTQKHFQAGLMGLLGKHGIQMQSVTLLSAATMSCWRNNSISLDGLARNSLEEGESVS